MLHVQRTNGEWSDREFRDFPRFLATGDLVVFNNTRVFPARLYGRRGGARAQPVSPHNPAVAISSRPHRSAADATNFYRPQRLGMPGPSRPQDRHGRTLVLRRADELQAEVLARAEFGERRIRFQPVTDFFAALERIGHVPLPPYISRADSPRRSRALSNRLCRAARLRRRSHRRTSFHPGNLDQIRQRGVETAEITLHVGLGTFQPIRVERVEDHKLHSESYSISHAAAATINQALRQSRRIVAIGTTTVRTLEHAVSLGAGTIAAGASAGLFIYPGFEFKVVQAMLTNFHLPQSSLLMLVSAFGGKENILRAYEHAVSEKYRFYSYGDCMFIE
jgi:S-adenosylmethionine:tRNA ribosyltransferase-isomerase